LGLKSGVGSMAAPPVQQVILNWQDQACTRNSIRPRAALARSVSGLTKIGNQPVRRCG